MLAALLALSLELDQLQSMSVRLVEMLEGLEFRIHELPVELLAEGTAPTLPSL